MAFPVFAYLLFGCWCLSVDRMLFGWNGEGWDG